MTAELAGPDAMTESLISIAPELPFDEDWLVSMGLLAETAHALRDREAAASLYEQLLPYGDRIAVGVVEISMGPVARYLALLAMTVGDVEAAEDHFVTALELAERIGARSWLAHAQRDYADLLSARADAGDANWAITLRSKAEAAYREMGMRW